MQVRKNGIRVMNSQPRKKVKPKVEVNLTMELFERGKQVVETVPEFHPDYKTLKARGFKIIGRFEVM